MAVISGATVCGCCNRGIVLVSGRHGGYYGCVAARVRGCDNRVRVRRDLAEKIIVNALQERLADPRAIRYVFEQLREEVARLCSDVPDQIRRRKEQLGRERRRLDNFVNFIADGRDSAAVQKTEQKVLLLDAQIAELTRTSSGFRVPSLRTIERRCKNLRALLDSSLQRSALVVRELLAPIRLDPVVFDSGRRYYVARTTFDTLKLLEDVDPDGGSDPGATAFKWWTRSQRLRTLALDRFGFHIRRRVPTPLYQRIASDAAALHRRGWLVSVSTSREK